MSKTTIIPGLSENKILRHTSDGAYHRGVDCYRQGAVREVVQSGQQLKGAVEGSQYNLYQVEIKFDAVGIKDCYCDCPYDDDYCKHVVAVLLTCLKAPDSIKKDEAFKESIRALNKEQLCELVVTLANQDSRLYHRITTLINEYRCDDTGGEVGQNRGSRRKTLIEPEFYADEAWQILHSLDHMTPSQAYQYERQVIQELGEIIAKAERFMENNDGHNAIVVLKALTEVYVEGWMNLEGSSGQSGDFFHELDDAWAEALLTVALSPKEKKALLETFDDWQNEVSNYGIDDAFLNATLALERGWEHPSLLKILNGETVKATELVDEDNFNEYYYRPSITDMRLKILARQQRYQEYIHLATAKKMTRELICMLIQQGHVEEAVTHAKTHLKKSEDALAVAKQLRDHNAIEEAINIAKSGLNLKGRQLALA